MLLALIYTATYSPFRVAFYTESSNALLIFETIIDTLFIIDLVLMFFVPYERQDGSYESRFKKIGTNYICGGFWIDCVACFPTQLFEKSNEGNFDDNSEMQSQANKLARIARL
jgi:hypothetical protein